MEKNYCLPCGSKIIKYHFFYPETEKFFDGYLKNSKDINPVCSVSVSPEYMKECRWLIDADEKSVSFLEFQSLMIATANSLLYYGCALFHGAALMWKKGGWIITAPSGTGKTTQLKNWKRLLKSDVKIINGDKPVIESKEDGFFYVCSSPWRGKEKYGIRGISVPLKGIIILERGMENQIIRISPEEAAFPLFEEFVSFPENKEQIQCQAAILKRLLNDVPVWKLINTGDEDSTSMTVTTLEKHLEN